MKLKFLQAGIKSRGVDPAFYGAKLFFPLLLVFTFLLLKMFVYVTMANTYFILILVLLGLLGFYLPDIWLKQKTDKRKIKLFKALPDALDYKHMKDLPRYRYNPDADQPKKAAPPDKPLGTDEYETLSGHNP